MQIPAASAIDERTRRRSQPSGESALTQPALTQPELTQPATTRDTRNANMAAYQRRPITSSARLPDRGCQADVPVGLLSDVLSDLLSDGTAFGRTADGGGALAGARLAGARLAVARLAVGASEAVGFAAAEPVAGERPSAVLGADVALVEDAGAGRRFFTARLL
jgi:hypothetical protein